MHELYIDVFVMHKRGFDVKRPHLHDLLVLGQVETEVMLR